MKRQLQFAITMGRFLPLCGNTLHATDHRVRGDIVNFAAVAVSASMVPSEVANESGWAHLAG